MGSFISVHDVGNWNWGAIVGGVALVVAGISLWFSGLRPWLEAREASKKAFIELQYEHYMFGNKSKSRLVIANTGRADAYDVTLRIRSDASPGSSATEPPFPVPFIRGGTSVYWDLTPTHLAQREYLFFEVTWRDRTGPMLGEGAISANDIVS